MNDRAPAGPVSTPGLMTNSDNEARVASSDCNGLITTEKHFVPSGCVSVCTAAFRVWAMLYPNDPATPNLGEGLSDDPIIAKRSKAADRHLHEIRSLLLEALVADELTAEVETLDGRWYR